MTTFKDLLSAENLGNLKQMATKTESPKPTTAPNPQKSAPKKREPASDTDLFKTAMAGVKPLKNKPAPTPKQPQKSAKDPNAIYKRAMATGTDTPTDTPLSDMQALLNPVGGEAFLSYKIPTLPNKSFELLKQGKLRWYDAVDLHGASLEEARQAVLTLIHHATRQGDTVVKITHGKGETALLKTCVNGWLRQLPSVLAFVSAPAKDGGTGAVLVLLKKDKSLNHLDDDPYAKY